ncbi:MAG: hypothetical protein IJ282_01690, partial [Lachnospiraceae bacterium]|nr:hypothetical protein [Lachnospiraceae bacterium]
DPKLYLESYADLQAAFGQDYVKAVEHYLMFGINEGRTQGLKTVQVAGGDAEADENADADADEDEDDRYEYEYEYDEQGRVIKKIALLDGEVYMYQIIEYNEAGQKSHLKEYMPYGGTDYLMSETDLIYDANGLLSQTIEEDYYGIVTVTDYENGKKKTSTKTYADGSTLEKEYDADENWITRVDRDSEGNFECSFEREYINGKLVKETVTNADGSTEVSEFDADENQISRIDHDSEGNLEFFQEWEYVDGELVKTIYTDAEGSVCVTEFDDYENEKKITRYDSEGNVESVEEREYVDGKLVQCIYTEADESGYLDEYDDNENLIKRTSYDSGRVFLSVFEWEYLEDKLMKEAEYDAQGQLMWWNEYEYYENGDTKKITYYDEDGNVTYVEEY